MKDKDNEPDFYLAATDYTALDAPAKCWRIKQLRGSRSDQSAKVRSGAARDRYLLMEVDPPFKVDPPVGSAPWYANPVDVDKVLVSARDPYLSWDSVGSWPVFVFVLRAKVSDIEDREVIYDDEFEVIEWAALFPTDADARKFL